MMYQICIFLLILTIIQAKSVDESVNIHHTNISSYNIKSQAKEIGKQSRIIWRNKYNLNSLELKEYFYDCKEQGTYLVRINGNYYYFSKTASNWHEAREACVLKKMQLVQIDSTDEYQAILNHLYLYNYFPQDHTSYWIAGNDLATEGTYKNLVPNQYNILNVQSITWASNQPDNINNEDEDCLEIRYFDSTNTGTNDYECGLSVTGYICEVSWQCQQAFEYKYQKNSNLLTFLTTNN